MDHRKMIARVAANAMMRRIAHRQAVLRVAYRYLMAVISPKYDTNLKLQILEGVAGVPWGSWFKQPRQGVKKAERAFKESNLDPGWLGRSGSLYDIIHRSLSGLTRSLQDADPDDFIQEIAFQTGINPRTGREIKKALYEVGVAKRNEILNGKTVESTASFAAGAVKNKVLNALDKLHRDRKRTGPTIQVDELGDLAPSAERDEQIHPMHFIQDIVDDPRDSLGEKIREKMYALVGQSELVRYALDTFKQTGKFPSEKEIADATGATTNSVYRAMKKYYERLQHAVQDPSIQRELDTRLEIENLTGYGLKKKPTRGRPRTRAPGVTRNPRRRRPRTRRASWEDIPF